MHRVNQELGELISAIGTPWFSNTLPAVIRCAFNYDYFLLASYNKNQPLHIIRSDFQEVEMQQTLHYLVAETYVAEPIFRLFNAGKTAAGVYDMDELVARSLALPEPPNLSSPHLQVDDREEIGWRTTGWPEYLQETCILVPIDDVQLVAVSLFNFGLKTKEPSWQEPLDTIYPILSSATSKHFQQCSLVRIDVHSPPIATETNQDSAIYSQDVTCFFESRFDASITAREADIFAPLLQGNSLAAIAETLCISVYTARTHRRNVYRKIGHGRLPELINLFHAYINRPTPGL